MYHFQFTEELSAEHMSRVFRLTVLKSKDANKPWETDLFARVAETVSEETIMFLGIEKFREIIKKKLLHRMSEEYLYKDL